MRGSVSDQRRGRPSLRGRTRPESSSRRRACVVAFGVIPAASASSVTFAETVAAPLSFGRGRIRPRAKDLNERALILWERVGLERELLDRKPHEVSDGQLQRALVVRGLVRPVRYLFADEPTSALGSRTASRVWDVIGDVVAEDQAAAAIVSHDSPLLTAMASTTIRITAQ